jgi:hypothetical protein
MADHIYCGTIPPVDAVGTQALLTGPHHAIWSPPHFMPHHPVANDRIWLVWRSGAVTDPVVLAGGRVLATDDGDILWTNATLPGVVPAARGLNYRGPTNMAFLHMTGVVAPEGRPTVNLGAIDSGLNHANEQQVLALTAVLDIP